MTLVQDDSYELIEPLAGSVGDFAAETYKAREREAESADASGGRVVLLRRLPPRAVTDEVVAAAQKGQRLPRHPNVLDTYGVVEIPEGTDFAAGTYIVSEYVRGISLRERIRRVAPFSLTIALDFAASIAQALQFGIDQGLPHGHLCPDEVILTPEGQVRVADFALADAVQDTLRSASNVSRNDVRSLGSILYEMLTGALPNYGGGDEGLSPRTLNSNVPPAIDGITRKALTSEQGAGYVSVAEMLADLQAAREDLRSNKPLTWTPLGSSARAATGAAVAAGATDNGQPKKPRGRLAEPYEYEPPPNPWPGRILTAVFMLVVVGIIGAVVLLMTVLTVPADTVVPNLVGKSLNDAQVIAKANHFNLVAGTHVYSDLWPANTVATQDVPPGREIKSGKDVNVVVSDGPPLAQVPDVTQVALGKAKQMIVAAGLPVGVESDEYNDVVPKGIVTAQAPTGGSMVSHKTPINITVSKGPNPPPTPTNLNGTATIPNEIDLTWDEVANASGYNVYRDGSKVGKGLQSPAYSDNSLGNAETHSYTVTAVNINGESAQSPPVSATTLDSNGQIVSPTTGAPPTPSDTTGTAPSDTGAAPSDTTGAAPTPAPTPPIEAPAPTPVAPPTPTPPRQRQFHIRFKVPTGGDHHEVQIQVQDATGTNVVYDETREPGAIVDYPNLAASGNKVVIRIYIDGKLVKQQTR